MAVQAKKKNTAPRHRQAGPPDHAKTIHDGQGDHRLRSAATVLDLMAEQQGESAWPAANAKRRP
jgi:hypothetical protein